MVGYVNEVHKSWEQNNAKVFTDPEKPEKVMLGNIQGKYVAISPVDDYIHRPKKYKNVSLYDWIRQHKKTLIPTRSTKVEKDNNEISNNVSNYSDYDDTPDIHQSNILKKQVDIDAPKHEDEESDSETVEIQDQQTYNLRKTV